MSIRKITSFNPPIEKSWKEFREGGFDNVICTTDDEDKKWIEETTEAVGAWRDLCHSTYMRWAITINGMYVSSKYYEESHGEKELMIHTIRVKDGSAVKVPMAQWTGKQAAENYEKSVYSISSYGLSDLFGALEDITFEMFEIFYRHNPRDLISGEENREIKKAYKNRNSNPERWGSVFSDRFETWRRKKVYLGLGKVQKLYWEKAGLQRPSSYVHTTPEDWFSTIKMFSLIRNHIMHGASTANKELAEATKINTNMDISFEEGEELSIQLYHLMCLECFLDQYHHALNLALFEKFEPAARRLS